jgi:hypothetical protein
MLEMLQRLLTELVTYLKLVEACLLVGLSVLLQYQSGFDLDRDNLCGYVLFDNTLNTLVELDNAKQFQRS